MKSISVIIGTMLLLTACTPAGVTTDTNVKLGGELSDCTYHKVANGDGGNIHVIRCPNSDVSAYWSSGKSKRSAVTLEENKQCQ